jgi:hypothetical protein
MPRFFLATIAAIGLFGVSAFAADMPTKAPPASTPIAVPFNWSGFYVGTNFGGGWTSGNLNIPGNNFYGGISELIGGVQAGYNVQAGSLLFGVRFHESNALQPPPAPQQFRVALTESCRRDVPKSRSLQWAATVLSAGIPALSFRY